MKVKRLFFLVLGCVCLGLGCIGVVLPILPTVKKKGMTVQTKVGIMVPVTLLMGIGIFMMLRGGIVIPSIILAIVWVCHVIYFVFGVKTIVTNSDRAVK